MNITEDEYFKMREAVAEAVTCARLAFTFTFLPVFGVKDKDGCDELSPQGRALFDTIFRPLDKFTWAALDDEEGYNEWWERTHPDAADEEAEK